MDFHNENTSKELNEITNLILNIQKNTQMSLHDIKLFLNNQSEIINFDWLSDENKKITNHNNLIEEGYFVQNIASRNYLNEIYHFTHDMPKYKSIIYYHPKKIECIIFTKLSNLIEGPINGTHGGCLMTIVDSDMSFIPKNFLNAPIVTAKFEMNFLKLVPLNSILKISGKYSGPLDEKRSPIDRKVYIDGQIELIKNEEKIEICDTFKILYIKPKNQV
jgi:hypothetical protein